MRTNHTPPTSLVTPEDQELIDWAVKNIVEVGKDNDVSALFTHMLLKHPYPQFDGNQRCQEACKIAVAYMRLATDRLNQINYMRAAGYL